jgi:DNA repair protein SbcC/Rad50
MKRILGLDLGTNSIGWALVDEAEGIGSNFDLLERIAKAKNYQLISISINPLDGFREGEQYLYILNGSKKRKERVNTFAIFSNADEIQKI